jgi:hypothetical protein
MSRIFSGRTASAKTFHPIFSDTASPGLQSRTKLLMADCF